MTVALLKKTLSSNMKIARKKLSLSQEKLAEKADISVQMISDIEGSRRWPSEKTLVKIANALEEDVYALFIPQTDECPSIHALKKKMAEKLKIELEKTLDDFVEN